MGTVQSDSAEQMERWTYFAFRFRSRSVFRFASRASECARVKIVSMGHVSPASPRDYRTPRYLYKLQLATPSCYIRHSDIYLFLCTCEQTTNERDAVLVVKDVSTRILRSTLRILFSFLAIDKESKTFPLSTTPLLHPSFPPLRWSHLNNQPDGKDPSSSPISFIYFPFSASSPSRLYLFPFYPCLWFSDSFIASCLVFFTFLRLSR